MSSSLPIAILVEDRCGELGLTKPALVRRIGYRNEAKGIRRLEALSEGNLVGLDDLISKLPTALGALPETVIEAVEATRRELAQQQQEERRRTFVPHALIRTERKIPSSITMAGFIGVGRIMRIDLDTSQPRTTFVHQALREMNKRVARYNGQVPFMGKPTGITIAYDVDRTVTYDLEGRALTLEGAVGEPRSELQVV